MAAVASAAAAPALPAAAEGLAPGGWEAAQRPGGIEKGGTPFGGRFFLAPAFFLACRFFRQPGYSSRLYIRFKDRLKERLEALKNARKALIRQGKGEQARPSSVNG